ncbi:fasciclin domain-containing protein [Tuwongella immobilis]|uniref:FAS1 domain-containing protein n=1 Tax=Tuwongella immobilis TaxID=692036 RepID=A0A6C2YT11_9BACT|nr:fasciclin domain-containing protein [Tuwongella immobilis]VIP04860.1 Beta-Ig-H3/fasciclin OS=Pirellula staleyi (strain ATCC 27377 / DSM 6068 / ICPB 4128) GN=Psta_4322 PE=4 SV=1: Fasciclin [Tuwongella immobilis]VTS07079.1 Beta-Ig-H3/fasciclin OS=Pirellula staleyi (strain ATCC 27377 / DSM 6068 / ICPB 4128) GN=Psta_4322 PE=4 SV=1: Fasciclin [Tuwongella immobilis]
MTMRALMVAMLALATSVFTTSAKAADKDIVDTAVAAGSFKTLATALEKAGLVETLKGKGPFTVFAPTDAAFAKLPKETLSAVLADKEKLTKILLAHVVVGKAVKAETVVTLDGKAVNGFTVQVKGKTVMLGDAKVLKTDIETSNGVIHVIDTVLIPKE